MTATRLFISPALPVLLLLLLALPDVVADDRFKARLWSAVENTRLVLESDVRLQYTVSDITSPPRLFIDIKSADAEPDIINQISAPLQPYIKKVRAARHDADTLRIVFDLGAVIHYRVHRLAPIEQYQHRLVIDIAPQTPPEDPLLALLEQLQKAPDAPDFLVLIDPGHGGEDPGAVSPNNNYEKNVVLRISRKLADAVNRYPGMQAVLTRDNDRFIPLFERVRIAHRIDADAFVSIHADSVKNRKARGSSVFILSRKGASSRFARQLAKQENLSDVIGGQPVGGDPQYEATLKQFSQDGKDRASQLLADLMLKNMGKINRLHSRRVQSAGFAVLKSPFIPSVLVETAFISNPQEEKKLLDDKFQQQLVDGLAQALDTYRRRYHHVENLGDSQ